MPRTERSGAPEADSNEVSTVKEHTSIRPSMLYNVLPTMVSNRIPALPSLRESLSGKRRSKSQSLTELPQPETPPPYYTSRPGSGSVTPQIVLGEADFEVLEDASERPGSSASTIPSLFATYETRTGISWRYASSGISLMTQAYRESTVPLQHVDESSTSLTRQLYVHGMTYLLRGLPTDLTPEETASLQSAIPQGVVDVRVDSSTHALVPVSKRRSITQEAPPQEPTALHRITAIIVFQTFILIQFLLPYIKLLLSHTYQFERKHQITKRLVNTSVSTVDELSRRSIRLSQTVCQMNEGRVGQAINEMTIWWVSSVTGGIQQGIEEGLSTMRATAEHPQRRVTVEK